MTRLLQLDPDPGYYQQRAYDWSIRSRWQNWVARRRRERAEVLLPPSVYSSALPASVREAEAARSVIRCPSAPVERVGSRSRFHTQEIAPAGALDGAIAQPPSAVRTTTQVDGRRRV